MSGIAPGFDVFRPYVPRTLRRRLTADPDALVETLDATCMFADISGFTALSERLAKRGLEGAELLAEAINACFAELLAEAYEYGGSLLKFGGDAQFIMFDGEDHAARACSAAVRMRETLRRVGRLQVGSATIVLKISIGVHSGQWHMFLVGGSHRELIVDGPATTALVAAEAAANAGEILVTDETVPFLAPDCVGLASGPGRLLTKSPEAATLNEPEPLWQLDAELVAGCLPTAVREYVRTGPHPPEHRRIAIGFLNYRGTNDLLAQDGLDAVTAELDALVRDVQEVVDEYRITFLSNDIAGNGGKVILVAGAPTASGDHAERLLIALRTIVTRERRLDVRAGVTLESVFTGEIGPVFRRTYTIMGDGVNLAARLMAAAPFGSVYASLPAVEASRATFRVTPLEPFMVKGKAKPVEAVEVGDVVRSTGQKSVRLPELIGRERELETLRTAVEAAKRGTGRFIEIVGDGGSGKTRMLEETREMLPDGRLLPVSGEAYTSSTPYAVMRDLCRQFLGVAWDDPDEVVLPVLDAAVTPELRPWLPLLAVVIGVNVPATREVDDLSPDHRQRKLLESLRLLIAQWADAGVLIHVQRAHLIDAASAALLSGLVDFIASTNWVLVSTRPFVETGFVGSGKHVKIELGPLSEDALQRLADTFTEATPLPPHSVTAAIERSGGNAEFLLDLLSFAAHSADAELPQDVMAVATLQIDELEPTDRHVVQLASVLGIKFHPADLAALMDDPAHLPSEQQWRRLESIFIWDGDEYVFRRGLHREAAYAALPFRIRRELHAKIAKDMLRRLLEGGEDVNESALSMHHELAGNNAGAHAHALSAARNAAHAFSFADAVGLYRRALETGRAAGAVRPRLAAVWEELATAYERTGEPAQAHGALTQARRLTSDPLVTGRLLLSHAQLSQATGDNRAAVRWANRGLRVVPADRDPEPTSLRAQLTCVVATVRMRQGRPLEAEALCRGVLADPASGRAARARALSMLDWALCESDRADQAHYSDSAVAIHRADGEVFHEATALNNMGGYAYWRGDFDEAVRLYGEAGEGFARAGDDLGAAFAAGNIGEVLLEQGRLPEAEESLRVARRLARGMSADWVANQVGVLLGHCLSLQGSHEAAIEMLTECTEALRAMGNAMAETGDQFLAEATELAGHTAPPASVVVVPT